jgi:hypothetical protein
MQVQAIIRKVLPKETGSSKNGEWVKNQFVVETKEQYSKTICFQYWKDDVPLLLGSVVDVSFSIESREYNERWYTEAKAFAIKVIASPANVGADNTEANFENQKPKIDLAEEDGDSLPF